MSKVNYGKLKKRSHMTKFSSIFPPISSVRYLIHYRTDRAEWAADPFATKFYMYSLIQTNIGLNLGDGLNFALCEHSLNCQHKVVKKRSDT